MYINPNPATFDFPNPQYFSIPFVIISYITKNPLTAGGLLKLQKTCKYFFSKNKIIVIYKHVYFENDNYILQNPLLRKLKLSLNKSKYWLNYELTIFKGASINFSKAIYRCNLKKLAMSNQHLTLDEIDFLLNGGRITTLWLNANIIRDDKGFLVTCDRVLKKVPYLMSFIYDCKIETFSSKTFENMNALLFKTKFEFFDLSLYKMAPDVDIKLLSKFIVNNSFNLQGKNSRFYFKFLVNNPWNYSTALVEGIDILVQEWEKEKLPYIKFY